MVEFTVRRTQRSLTVMLNKVKIASVSKEGKVRRYRTDLTADASLLARLVWEPVVDSLRLDTVVGPGVVNCVHQGEQVVAFVKGTYCWSIRFPTGRTINLLRGESRLIEEALRHLLFPDTFTIAEPDTCELPYALREKYDAVFEAAHILGGVAVYTDAEKADTAIGNAIGLALHVLRKANLIV